MEVPVLKINERPEKTTIRNLLDFENKVENISLTLMWFFSFKKHFIG